MTNPTNSKRRVVKRARAMMRPVLCRCQSTMSSNERPAGSSKRGELRACDRARRLVHRWEIVKRSGRAVRQPGSSNDLAIGRFEHDGDVLAFGKSLVDLERRSRPLPDRAERSDDVRLFQRPAAVLSAADRRRMVVVKADEKDLAGAGAGADLDGNLPPAALRDAHGRGGAAFAFPFFYRLPD